VVVSIFQVETRNALANVSNGHGCWLFLLGFCNRESGEKS
jgi:hypothetical protein